LELPVLFGFVAVASALIVLPGPDWALVLASGLNARSTVIPAVTGLAMGYVFLTLVVAGGIASLVAANPAALTVLTFVGALYLLWVGTAMAKAPRPTADVDAPADRTPARWLVRGAGVSALNPKSLLFFLAFLPQFAHTSAPWPFGVQLLALGSTWVVLAFAFYAVLGRAAEHTLAGRPILGHVVGQCAGVAMGLIGLSLMAKELTHLLS
jgi:threonine/homoserine/homoserine lactone efflux protein